MSNWTKRFHTTRQSIHDAKKAIRLRADGDSGVSTLAVHEDTVLKLTPAELLLLMQQAQAAYRFLTQATNGQLVIADHGLCEKCNYAAISAEVHLCSRHSRDTAQQLVAQAKQVEARKAETKPEAKKPEAKPEAKPEVKRSTPARDRVLAKKNSPDPEIPLFDEIPMPTDEDHHVL